jgi:hypothetical protein
MSGAGVSNYTEILDTPDGKQDARARRTFPLTRSGGESAREAEEDWRQWSRRRPAMTVFDYLVLAIVVISLLLGMWRGVVGEIIALVAWVLAFFAAKAGGVPSWASRLSPC